ncbi:MAG TPA: DNA-3-methyladenine glycosylase [Alphaproteobacteria bacterium]|jgi:DNA-3-methyladenine glycosylase|nr:DNA-3-methyladenine glycosylase [Alphaproteobacteria bacterium]
MTKILTSDFYNRNPLLVAPDLLGKILVRNFDGKIISGRIVETEAYLAFNDEASHSFVGKTERNKSLFGKPGTAYVHSIHMQNCIDVVTEGVNIPSSVLIRALEPLEAIEIMKSLRGKENLKDLTTGPGKLCKALAITKGFNGYDLTKLGDLYIIDDNYSVSEKDIIKVKRIGISKATENEYRFYLKDSQFISKK